MLFVREWDVEHGGARVVRLMLESRGELATKGKEGVVEEE